MSKIVKWNQTGKSSFEEVEEIHREYRDRLDYGDKEDECKPTLWTDGLSYKKQIQNAKAAFKSKEEVSDNDVDDEHDEDKGVEYESHKLSNITKVNT